MQKTTKFLGVISLIFLVFTLIIFVQFLIQSSASGSGSGWEDLGFFLIALVFLAIALILSIPFLVIGLKLKFKQMRFYTFSHLSYLLISMITFVISLG